MSLAELSVVILLLGVLFAMTMPIVATLFNTTTYVNNTYENEDQLLPVSTHLQSLIRGAVSPDPTPASGVPVPAFGLYSPTTFAYTGTPLLTATSILFFTNTGDLNGPTEVAATLTGQTFLVTTTKATPNTCSGAPGGAGPCKWGTPHTLLRVTNVVNTASQPIFAYTLDGQAAPLASSALATTFQTCNSATNCNANQIQDMAVDLKVNVSSNPSQAGQADDETVIYQLSATSQAYSSAVG